MRGIEVFELRKPERSKGDVRRGLDREAAELGKDVLGGVVGEAGVDGDELLVEDRGAEEKGHLLLFGRVTRNRQSVSDAGENEAGDAAFEGLKESELSAFEGDDQIALANFNTITGRESVNVFGIEAKPVQGSKNIPGGRIRGSESRTAEKKQNKQDAANAHPLSVVTFGIWGQGGGERPVLRIKIERCGN